MQCGLPGSTREGGDRLLSACPGVGKTGRKGWIETCQQSDITSSRTQRFRVLLTKLHVLMVVKSHLV